MRQFRRCNSARRMLTVAIVLIVAMTVGATLADEPAEQQKPLVDQIDRKIEQLKDEKPKAAEELRELREKLKQLAPAAKKVAEAKPAPLNPREARQKALAEIKLPENFTKQDARDYVAAIFATTVNQNSWSSSDPHADMLVKIGGENVDILIDEISKHRDITERYYLLPAISRLVTDGKNKAKLIERLDDSPQLIDLVIHHGWETDAREVLVEKVNDGVSGLPVQWYRAVATFKDRDTYVGLAKCFIQSNDDRTYFYDAVKDLPGFPIDGAVALAWEQTKENAQFNGSWQRQRFARIAVKHGVLDALGELVNELPVSNNNQHRFSSSRTEPVRLLVLKHIRFRGTNEEIKAWFKENRDSLIYDADEMVYLLRPVF